MDAPTDMPPIAKSASVSVPFVATVGAAGPLGAGSLGLPAVDGSMGGGADSVLAGGTGGAFHALFNLSK